MMKRRDFLKTTIITPFVFGKLTSFDVKEEAKYRVGDIKRFDFLKIKGSYRKIGYQIGQYFGDNMKKVIKRRSNWHTNLLEILRSKHGRQKSGEYLSLTKKHFPHLLEEIGGMADGAGLHFDAIWSICIKSELSAMDEEPTGCSTIFFPQKRWLFHNEDGHMDYSGLMFILKVQPPSGVNYISLVYPGTITGNGPSLNNKGIIQTTNFIGSTESFIGIPRYILGRAVLEAKNLQEARDIVCMAPRAYPYHYNIGSFLKKKYISVETTPETCQLKEPEEIYCHTNHLLFEKTGNYEFEDLEYKKTSSMSRYEVIQKELQNPLRNNFKPEDFINILSSHLSKPYSPCRHPQGDVQGQTLGTAFIDFEEGVFRLYKGNPCEALEGGRCVDFKYEEF
jgi:predicted choloylglycine hydrolase